MLIFTFQTSSKDRPEVLPLLRDRATNDPDEKIREFAQEQLEKLTGKSKS